MPAKRISAAVLLTLFPMSVSATYAPLETSSNPAYYGNRYTLQAEDVRRTFEANMVKQEVMNAWLYANVNKVDASGFVGNLSPTDDTLAEIARAFDLFVGGSGGSMTWPLGNGVAYYNGGSVWGVYNSTTKIPAAYISILNQDTTGLAGGLSAQYIDFNAADGPTSIKNKPTISTVDTTIGTFMAATDEASARAAIGAQQTLVSASNIKTVNGITMLGSGNISIGSGSSGYTGTVPTYSDEACVPGTYALSEAYRFDCVATGNWNRTALTNWTNPAPTSTYTLTVTDPGNGDAITCSDADLSAPIDCGGGETDCTATAAISAQITGITGVPAVDRNFVVWTGALTSSENPTTTALVMSGDKSLGGTFEEASAGVSTCTQRFADDFARSDGAVGNGWTTVTGSHSIVSGVLGTATLGAIANSAVFTNTNQWARVKLATAGARPMLVTRGNTSTFASYYTLACNADYTEWGSAGSAVESSAGMTCGNGDSIAAMVVGTGSNTVMSAWKNTVNGAPFSAGASCTDTSKPCWDSASDAPDLQFTADPGTASDSNLGFALMNAASATGLDDTTMGDCSE